MKTLTLFTLILAIFSVGALAQEGPNLLKNTTFVADNAGVVSNWQLPTYPFDSNPAVVSKLKWGVQNDGTARYLGISTKEYTKANVWWEQKLSANGGASYNVSGKVKGSLGKGSKYGKVKFVVAFLGTNGKWLGAQEICSVDPTEDWQTIKGKVTTPDDATTVEMRMGIDFEGEVQLVFDQPSLIEITK